MSKTLVYATVAGVAAGIVYVLSPLTVWFLVAIVPVISLAARGLETDERRWVTGMLIAAVALRLVAVAMLFLTTNHSQVAFGTFFGDEEYALDRSLWLRNVALNIPLHPADLVTAFESANSSGYLYVLELIQTLFGPSPYGLHLLGVLCYVAASVLLFRLVHSTLGRMPALLGLMVLLFLPSLFAWSVSILKEPPFVFVSALNLVVAVKLLRASTWKHRLLALMTLVAIAAVLEGIRQGGAVLSGAGVVIGLTLAFLATHPRFMLAALVATPIVVAATISRPEVQMKAFTAIRSAASQHWAYIAVSPGYGYKLLDERYYSGTSDVSDLGLDETMRFIVRAIVAYVAVPLPWKAQSRAALAYLPEQMVWYVLALLAPVGVLFAFRRDSGVTALLVGNGIVVALAVALTGGNVGALVRHRGLLLPYMVWMSAVGFCELLSNRLRRPAGREDLRLAYLAMAEHDSRG